MESEGVIQYRLLGSHPAASGRYHSFGFGGETVLVEAFLQEVVKQHQINLTKYKLEVRRLPPTVAEDKDTQPPSNSGESDVLNVSSVLHSYDRIVLNVSRRHYLDGAAGVVRNDEKAHEGHLQHVEHLLMSVEKPNSPETSRLGAEKRPRSSDESQDPHAFIRVAALSGKAFPLLPWMQRQRSANALSAPKPVKGTCVLCELECFDEVVLPCCHFSACSRCLELAKVMLVRQEECAVCGAVPGEKSTTQANCLSARVPVKQEGLAAGVGDAAERGRQAGQRGASKPGATSSDLRAVQARVGSVIAAFEADLTGNMTRVLSLLDVVDPLTPAAKEKRRVSATLAEFSNE